MKEIVLIEEKKVSFFKFGSKGIEKQKEKEKREGEDGEGVLDLAAYERGFLDFFVTVRPPVRVVLEAHPAVEKEGDA